MAAVKQAESMVSDEWKEDFNKHLLVEDLYDLYLDEGRGIGYVH